MIDAAERILTLVQGLSFEEFVYDRDVRDSIFYKIVVLGEAAGAVPPEIQATAPEIPWAELKDLRNWITHVYHAVGNRRVWQVITTELPVIVPRLKDVLDRDPGADGSDD